MKTDLNNIISYRVISLFFFTLMAAVSGCSDSKSTTSERAVASENFEQIDRSLDMAFQHARNYPPRFDSEAQRKNVESELKGVIKQLETMLIYSESNTEILFRLGKANTFTYNLDVSDSAEKARLYFEKLFSVDAEHAEGHLYYGQHLSGKGDWDLAVKHLEKAANGGKDIALQMIGIAYYQQGRKDEARDYLERCLKLQPDSQQLKMLLDSLDPSTENKYKFINKHN